MKPIILFESLYSFKRRDKIEKDRPRLERLLKTRLKTEIDEFMLDGEKMVKVTWIPLK
ncbi:hypothetical protein J7L36_02090 [bacterium]|nr:hypothetical protein [bacterium]